MEQSALKEKAVKAVSWNLFERFGDQAITFLLGIILARLLTPKDFGLVGLISVFFAIAQVLVHGGFGEAYIQKKDVTAIDANTVFWANLISSILLYSLLYIIAPVVAAFYSQPLLIDLIRIMGIVVVINALNIIQMARIRKSIDFKLKTKISLSATLGAGILAIFAAFSGFGVWSLVIQRIANRLFITAGLWVKSLWKPTFQFSKDSFRSLFSFGVWSLGANLVSVVFENVYVLTIGKLFPIAQLGFYSNAKAFLKVTSQQMSMAVAAVSFPVFAAIQADKVRLKDAIKKFLIHTLLFLMPLLITLMVIAEPFVILLLTDKWAPMIPYLQLLCIAGILYPVHSVNIQALQAQGRSDLNFKLSLIKSALRVVNIAVMYRWGIIFIILGEVILSIIALFINTYYTKRFTNYGIIDQLNDIMPIALTSIMAGLVGYIAVSFAGNIYTKLVFGLFVTLTCYVGLQLIFNKKTFFDAMNLKQNLLR